MPQADTPAPAGSSRPGLPVVLLALGVAAAAGALAWWGTSRPVLLDLDWDQAFHYWQIDGILTSGDHMCSAGGTLWTCAYTAHMALQPLYGLAALVTRHAHGTTLNAIRGVNAAGIAVAGGCLVLTLAECGASWWALLLVTAAWLFSSDVLFLVRTVEDDCLLLACASAVFFFCVRARRRWSVRSAFAAGAILGAGVLTNYAVIVWLPVLAVAGVILARPELPIFDRRRVAWGAAIGAGMAVVLAAWGAWSTVIDPAHWGWQRYLQVLFGSPNEGVTSQTHTVGAFLRYIAIYPLDVVLPPHWYPASAIGASMAGERAVAVLLIAAALAGAVWPFRRGVRAASPAAHAAALASLALIVCAIPGAWLGDTSAYERMDHVPLCLAVLAGAALSAWGHRMPRVRFRRALAGAVVVAVLAVNVVALARAPRNASWLARFEALRRSDSKDVVFVFAQSEFAPGDYDKLESLRIAIPTAIILSPDGAIRHWPFTPVTHESLDDFRASPPAWAWMSDPARALVQR